MILTSKHVYTAHIQLTVNMNTLDWCCLEHELAKEGFSKAFPNAKLEFDTENNKVMVSYYQQLQAEACGEMLEQHMIKLGYIQ